MVGEHLLDELGRFDGDAEILQAWRDGMAPEPALLVSEWADKHRMLGSRDSAEPGPYRTARTPYLREVMDALSPLHPARRVVFMKGAQVGATTCGSNWIGYVIHHSPGPMLAVQPTTELAKRFSDQRIDPLVEETPAIRQRVAPARSRDSGNRQLSKEFPGGQLVMTGANSAVGLRSMSARFLFLDEVDAYPGDVEGEGDPVALAEARARTFGWRRKVFLVSTPSRIAGIDTAIEAARALLPAERIAAVRAEAVERGWSPDNARRALFDMLVRHAPRPSLPANPAAHGGPPRVEILDAMVEPLIPANRWYLFAEPPTTPVYVYGYLNGAEGPQITTGPVSGVDGVEVSVIFDFGVGAIDWRGAWFNPGT